MENRPLASDLPMMAPWWHTWEGILGLQVCQTDLKRRRSSKLRHVLVSQVSNIRPAWNSPLTSACSLGALETLVPGISRSSKSHKLVWDILEFFSCRSARAQRQSTKICFSPSHSRQNRVTAWKLQTSQTHVHTCKVLPPFPTFNLL